MRPSLTIEESVWYTRIKKGLSPEPSLWEAIFGRKGDRKSDRLAKVYQYVAEEKAREFSKN